jgi:hypothetical protein
MTRAPLISSSSFGHPNYICWEASRYVVFSNSPLPRPSDAQYSLQHLFSNTISIRSSVHVSDQVSHPYKATENIKCLHESSYNRKQEHRTLGKLFKCIAHANCRSSQWPTAVLSLGEQFRYDAPRPWARPKWPLMWWHSFRYEATKQTAVRNNEQVR